MTQFHGVVRKEVMEFKMADNYLAHFGIKGMKWGERRYQNADGSLTALGRVHYGIGEAREKLKKPFARIVVSKATRKAKTVADNVADKVEEFNEHKKQKIIRSSNTSDILKYQDKLTTQELTEALTRVRNVNALNDLKAQELKRDAEARAKNSVFAKIGKVIDVGVNAVNAIDKAKGAVEKVIKWFNDEDEDVAKLTPDEVLRRMKENKFSSKQLNDLQNATNNRNNIISNLKKAKDLQNPNSSENKDFGKMTFDEIISGVKNRDFTAEDYSKLSKFMSSKKVVDTNIDAYEKSEEAKRKKAEARVDDIIKDLDDGGAWIL